MRIKNIFIIVLLLLFAYTLIPENLFSQETAVDRMDPALWGFNWGKIRKYIMYGKMNMYNKTFSDTTLFSGPYWRFTPTTRLKTESYSYAFQINDGGGSGTPLIGYMTGRAAKKTYGLYVNLARPADSTATGDSNDALLRLNFNNHAANDNNFIMRAINASLANRSGGNIGIMEGASIGVQGKSGGTTPYIRGMTITPENYGTCATEFSGIDVVMKNEGAKATLEYGLRVRNLNNSLGTYIDAGLLFSDTGANIGFNYIADMNGATVNGAEFRLSNAETIDNITNGTVQVVTPVFKQAYDALAYWTATITDGGKVTFDDVSDGVSGFEFADIINIGTSGAYKALTTGDNAIGLYVSDAVGTGYTDGVSSVMKATGGDGGGALRPIQASGTADVGANLGELYGVSAYAVQSNGSVVAANIYGVMGYMQINETGAGDDPIGYVTGVMGIYDTPGIDPTVSLGNPGFKAAVAGVVKDNANSKPHAAVMAFMEGDATGTTVPAAFKAVSVRSSAGGGFNYGLDLYDEAGYGYNIIGSDLRLSSGVKIFTGTAATGDAVFAEVGAIDAVGSIYLNATNGYIYIQVANTEAATDWFKVTATDAD